MKKSGHISSKVCANLDVCSYFIKIKARITSVKMKYKLHQRLIPSTNSFFLIAGLISVILLVSNCSTQNDSKKQDVVIDVQITPTPAKLLYKRGFFPLNKSTRILMDLSDKRSKEIGEILIDKIKIKTNYKLRIADRFTTNKLSSSIEIITDQVGLAKKEGFKLEIRKDKITIYASDNTGLFYAVNLTLDLLNKNKGNQWQCPQLLIEDYPNIAFRAISIAPTIIDIDNERLLVLAKKNRINNLFISSTYEMARSEYLTIHNHTLTKKDSLTNTMSIKTFYDLSQPLNDTLIFYVENINQLHPDSIALIGEAMWSKTSNRNYLDTQKSLH